MSTPASQLMLRHGRFFARKTTIRHASTTSEATQVVSNTAAKSKEIASEITSKASEGLTRVKSSTQPAFRRVAQGVNRTLGAIGGRAGRLFAFGTSLVPPTLYYSKVGFELGKLVVRGQKMNLPSTESLISYLRPVFSPIFQAIRHPTTFFSVVKEATTSIRALGISSRIRNISRPQLVSIGIVGAEVLGFFTVGEMIGRWKLIGYHGEVEHGEHH